MTPEERIEQLEGIVRELELKVEMLALALANTPLVHPDTYTGTSCDNVMIEINNSAVE